MLSSHSSAGSNIRRGTKRRRGPGSHCTADSTGSLGRQVRQCVQEGRWPNHPLAEANTTPPDLLTYSLHLGLCGISEREVRELGYGLTFNPTRYITHLPERKPRLLWIRSWHRRTCINTYRTSVKCYHILHSSTCSTCCATACTPGSKRQVPRQSRQRPLPSRRSTEASVPVVCQSCLHNFSNSMPNEHAEWLKGACGAYNLDRRYVMLNRLTPIRKLSMHICGARNRALGVNLFMKGTLRPYGCRCECCLENGAQQEHTMCHVPGRQSSKAASAFTCRTCMQIWLLLRAPMLPSNTVSACLMGRASHCPQQWRVKWLWKNLVKPFAVTSSRRQQQKGNNALISCLCGLQTGRRRTETSTMRGLPAVSRPLPRIPCPTHASPFRPMPQAPTPRTPPPNTPHRSKLAHKLRRDPPRPERRHPREGAAEVRASHRISPRFEHSCRRLHIIMEAAATCAGTSDKPIRSILLQTDGCYAVNAHWIHYCLQEWSAVVSPQPTAHHTAHPTHLRAARSPVPRFGEQSQEEQLAHRQPPPQGAYPCATACHGCSVCRYTHVSVHVGCIYCKSQQSHLVHAARAMPEPNAEQPPPPPLRGNVGKDTIGPGSEPMEPEEGLQQSSQKEPLSHGTGRMCRPDKGDAPRSPPVAVAGPLNPAGAGNPGPDRTGKMIAGEATAGSGTKHPLTMNGKTATTMTPTVRRMTRKMLT